MALTKIEWTATPLPDGSSVPGYTFNPWIGCTKVSLGCRECYAEDLMDTRYKRVKWGRGQTRIRTGDAYWREPLRWNKQAQAEGVRRRVFCASLADVFDEEVPEEWRLDLWSLISETKYLDWLLLTKRPQNIADMIPWCDKASLRGTSAHVDFWKHVWLGTSVENQAAADERIPMLLQVPAVVRFLSCEPLLGPVDLRLWDFEAAGAQPASTGLVYEIPERRSMLDWVIVGGEGGNKARSCHTDDVRSIVEQCREASVSCFVKQLGSNTVAAGRDQLKLIAMRDRKGGDMSEWPSDLQVRQFPQVLQVLGDVSR